MRTSLIKFLIRMYSSRAARIISVYIIISSLWIFFSDNAVHSLPLSEELRKEISIIKGWGFVLATSWLLFSLIRSALQEAANLNKQVVEAESKYKIIADNTADIIWNYNIKNDHLTYISPSVEKVLGYRTDEILKLKLSEILSEKSFRYISSILTDLISEFENTSGSVNPQTIEVEYIHKDKRIISAEISATLIKDELGKSVEIVGISRDITERKRSEKERETTLEFLYLINESSSLNNLIKSAVIFFQKYSGCGAVGIRLKEGSDYPYYASAGFPEEFILSENSLCSRNLAGIALFDHDGNPVLECVCGNVISGRFDPGKSFYTNSGSFWTNSTTSLLSKSTTKEHFGKTRNRCSSAGYESVALIPIRFSDTTFGLVQLNDKQSGVFSIETILMWERLVNYLAIAVSKFYAEAELYKSEERFRYLFENMVEGFAYCMMLFDNGKPVDFVYLNVNDKFEQLTGLKHAIGKKVSHLIPGIRESNPELLEIYGRVATTGEPERFESYVAPLDMWFSISVYSPKKEFFVAVFDVITERKRAEEALRKNEELLKLTGKMAKVGGWEFDAITMQGTWTDEVARIHDLDTAQATNVELGTSFYIGESKTRIEKAIKEAVESGTSYDLELEMITAKGNHKWVRTIAMPVKKDGRVTKITGSFQDITERKKAEEVISSNEQRLRIFVEHSPAAIAMFDQNMNYIIASRRYYTDYKIEEPDVVGRSHYEIFPEVQDRIKEIHKRCLAGATERADEDPFLRKDGRIDWVRWEVRPWYEGPDKIGGIILFSEVITDRKKAEAALLESEEKYRSIFNNSNIAILLTSPEGEYGKVLSANSFACKLFGMTEQEICSRGRKGLIDISDQRLKSLLDTREKTGHVSGRLTFVKKDGTKFEGELTSAVFFDKEGNKRTSMIIQDLTEKIRAEEEILKSRTLYRELAAHLQTVREEERTAIAREMHDELGQILSSIKMNLVLIYRQVEERDNSNYMKILSEIESLNKTIDNAVAGVRKLITQLRPELLDKLGLIPAIEWYIQEYNKEVKIKCSLFAECDECHLDNQKELAVFRIIQESLTNAAKYSEASLIVVKLYKDKDHVNIEIIDNGKGIESKKLAEGKTFGLLGMRERANLIGGKLYIDSEPGKGTSIKLVI